MARTAVRVVSVLPSATEIVCALGQRGSLVGRSEECDFPLDVRSVPVVMRARTLDRDRPSGEIDARVRASLAEGQSLYTLDIPLLECLQPELLLTQDLCRVCSVTEDEVAGACERAGVRPQVVSLSPRSLNEVWQSVETIANALGCGSDGARLADALRRRAAPRGGRAGRVAVLEWIDPPIESGLWTPEMVALAGAESWSARAGSQAVPCTWDALEVDPPDLAIVSPCSFSIDRSIRELQEGTLGARLAHWKLPFGVWVADESYFSRPGPRLADGIDLVDRLVRGRIPSSGAPVVRWPLPSSGGAA
jgi:iron complex transport system substrate-binding protein